MGGTLGYTHRVALNVLDHTDDVDAAAVDAAVWGTKHDSVGLFIRFRHTGGWFSVCRLRLHRCHALYQLECYVGMLVSDSESLLTDRLQPDPISTEHPAGAELVHSAPLSGAGYNSLWV